MNQKICRIGILGAGRIGRLHAINIKNNLPQFRLTALADPFLDTEWAAQLGIDYVGTDVKTVLFHSDLDAILVASPSNLHLEHICAASEAGKAIFCEKPIGLNEEEIVMALDQVRTNNTLLQLGFNRRFDPSFAHVAARVAAGETGATHLVKITSRDPMAPPKEYIAASGGMFMDMSIHDFDMARFLTGSEVVEVFATGAVLIDSAFKDCNDIDTALIQLRFANGALGVIDNSRQAAYGYDQRIEVFGAKGMLKAGNQLLNTVTACFATGSSYANPQHFFLDRYQESYLAELSAFHTAWANGAASPVSGHDGLQALRIAKAAKLSLETRMPVAI